MDTFGFNTTNGSMIIDLPGSWDEDLDLKGLFQFSGSGGKPFDVNGCSMHLRAIEMGEDGRPVSEELNSELDHLSYLIGYVSDGFRTTVIKDRRGRKHEVVVYMLPFGR